jgi:ribosome biogenesis GTPase
MSGMAMSPALPHPLADLGWGGPFDAHFAEHAAPDREPGRVVATHRETAIVRIAGGTVAGHVAGRFRRDAIGPADYPAVGDWVVIEPRLDERSGTIHAVLPRRSAITRTAGDSNRRGGGRLVDEQVLAANVDVALIVASIAIEPNLRRLERYLALAWGSDTLPVVVLNKADAAPDLVAATARVETIAAGADVHPVSALTRAGIDAVAGHLASGRTAVVLGPSGVGKSTLVNALLGEERQVTRAIREADGRGRHTTTHRELIPLPTGALLIDTPGIRSLELLDADEGVGPLYADIDAIAADCRFADCRHEREPGCAVRAAVDGGSIDGGRWASYRKLERHEAHVARESDFRAREAERRRWKLISKSAGKRMKQKYGDS